MKMNDKLIHPNFILKNPKNIEKKLGKKQEKICILRCSKLGYVYIKFRIFF